MGDSINLFPEPHLNEKVVEIFNEAKAYAEKHQIIFCDTHARMVLDAMTKVAHFMDTTNPLRNPKSNFV